MIYLYKPFDNTIIIDINTVYDFIFFEVIIDDGYDLQFLKRVLLVFENRKIINPIVENIDFRDSG